MIEIQLPNGKWLLDEQSKLGEGGFGAVFRGTSESGGAVAVKRLETGEQGREIRIADFLLGHTLLHVIPILDAGYDDKVGTNFIVMPMAEGSLQKRIDKSGPIAEAETIAILDSVAAGLEEIGDIIHRDLKPGNVLLHEGLWKLADLGLARFIEASTSANTMRENLTRAYGAPEQWRGERPQKTTDVYALGCMIYAMLQGKPPFLGPDFSHQHQFAPPPPLTASSHIKRLAAACLAKSPELRPSIQSVRNQLKIAGDVARGGRAGLAAAAAAVGEQELQKEAQRLEAQRRAEQRKRLRLEALEVLEGIFRELETNILQDAPNTKKGASSRQDFKKLSLGAAKLEYGISFPEMKSHGSTSAMENAGYAAGSRAWDVLAGAYIFVGNYNRGRSANLWFGRLLDGDDYRWWEVAYTDSEGKPARSWDNTIPFAVTEMYGPYLSYYVAEDPIPITPEFVDQFLDRWIGWFSLIAAGEASEVDKAFPVVFKRARVSAKFKLDKP